ncbi:hypothetical protein F5J12DRAFT_903538 [Pisolithus orientalis]|uniref:uncharacterized protein n=1 Tax=Pisolithus orientalis TaxID=936130 RepID=UPI00222442B7|nr:uncharacterized protein F5J12DRAFT_903538 [Pisolithus orientalis]KAI6028590.1 hypothetical protein F5J12DRAFT_903538 [Pisolithus orientalis]
MTTARTDSQTIQYGRRRSNTLQSTIGNPPPAPLKHGDFKVLNTWVHEPKESPKVIFNQSWWPGVAEGDVLRITAPQSEDFSGILFTISLPKNAADVFGLKNNTEVTVTKVDREEYSCVFVEQEISFIGVIAAKVQNIYVNGKKVSAGYVTSKTKAIYRSLSAKVTIFIQVCRELWEFAGDGERYNEKIIHSYLPALFAKWREAGTNHTVTIVLISRVFYDESELEYAAGPLRRDEDGNWYKDFYKVITDLEVINDWKPTLVDLKDSFWAFQRDILLTHHYHQAFVESTTPDQARLVGRISYAHDGPILESLNLALNPNETHYIDRSLSLTWNCNYPNHPGDSFRGYDPKPDKDGKNGSRTADPLWGGDEIPNDATRREKVTFWWEPFWIGVTFWDKQMDLPFRQGRFIARAKMHEIQMLGLLAHDVLANIEIPFLPEIRDPTSSPPRESLVEHRAPTAAEAEQADMEVFVSKEVPRPLHINRTSYASSSNGTVGTLTHRPSTASERRAMASQRGSITSSRIAPILESPRRIFMDLPREGDDSLIHSLTGRSTSPSQSSLRSERTSVPSAFMEGPTTTSETTSSRLAKLATSWFYNPFRVPVTPSVSIARSPRPMAILHSASGGPTVSRTYDEDSAIPHHGSFRRHSPLNSPQCDDTSFGVRRRATLTSLNVPLSSSFPSTSSHANPSRPQSAVSYAQSSLASRWKHVFPMPVYKHEVKWASMVTPACLPLTVEHFPSNAELESSYDVFSYDFVVDPTEMRSFMVKAPNVIGTVDQIRRAWALVVMRGMVAVRLAQGFQFVIRPRNATATDGNAKITRHSKSFLGEEDATPKPGGAAEVLLSTNDPVYLSMSNEIHRLSYTGEAIQVRRYPIDYECLIWPKLGVGYTELQTKFVSHGLENYGWNRLDMLVAGYEHQFNESLRYWRTRFVVIPSADPPQVYTGPSGEKLDEEEIRLMGIDKLAEMFTKARWQFLDERGQQMTPVRFLPTTLGPVHSVVDESLMAQLDEIHACRSRICLSLRFAKAMREEDGVPIKLHKWHRMNFPDSFTGFDFVSWLVREFRDVSSREQGAEWGTRLLEQGLFVHCTGRHGFLDGHYFYQLNGECATVSTPRGWFNKPRHSSNEDTSTGRGYSMSNQSKPSGISPKRNKRQLILTQSMIIDADLTKKSDQAESVILHHDIIQNPGTVFHFELQWIGSTARCIDDMLRQWGRTIEKYGLKLVEAYVTEISDIRERNPFQSCFPIRLSLPIPVVPDLERRVPEGTQTTHYMEYALLKRFGFIVDIESTNMYPRDVDVVYSYRRAPFKYSQFVHRSGVAFVQVLGDSQGFLFLTNRLMGSGRMGTTLKSRDPRPAAAAERIRMRLQEFCGDKAALLRFYEEEIAALGPDEPPPLSI